MCIKGKILNVGIMGRLVMNKKDPPPPPPPPPHQLPTDGDKPQDMSSPKAASSVDETVPMKSEEFVSDFDVMWRKKKERKEATKKEERQ